MKIVLAIINDDDSPIVMEELNEKGYMVTKLASTGGFLRSGNTTLITGVEDGQTDAVIKIFEEKCKRRDSLADIATPSGGMEGFMRFPIEVKAGGATIFILDVEQFVKV